MLGGVVIVGASVLVAGCDNCLKRWPETKDRTGLAMEGSFVASKVEKISSGEFSSWPTLNEPARLVMDDRVATLTVRVGADEYQFTYAMSTDHTITVETGEK
jgi:hypothetical protein